jgi:hypothetical protein
VSVKPALPAMAEVCDNDARVGAGLLIVNVVALEAPPPGGGLNAVTEAVPASAMSPTGTVAVTCVMLTTVVASAAPFQSITVPVSKLVPVTVSVNAGLPAIAEVCDNNVTVGTGLLIVKVIAADVPPPGSGLKTVMGTVPEFAMSAAGTVAVNEVALLNVVASAAPFQSATELATKLVPVRVSANVAVPPIAEVCESDASVGTGLLIVKVIAPDVPPPGAGSETVTEAVPASAMSPAGTAAVKLVPLTTVVTSAAPFQLIVEPVTKLVPVAVSVKPAPPATANVGPSDPSVGTGLLIEKLTAAEVPPPGVGMNTVTEALPTAAMSPAGTVAVRLVALTSVVASAAPFQSTTAPVTKLVPVTVSVKPALPSIAEVGKIDVSVGTGLLIEKV